MKSIAVYVAFLALLSGGHSIPASAASQPTVLSSSMSPYDYNQNYTSWVISHYDLDKMAKEGTSKVVLRTDVPALFIYDPSGKLVYYGTDMETNAKVISALPHLPAETKNVDNLPTRDSLFLIVPGFSKAKNAITKSPFYLVYSLMASSEIKKGDAQASATQALRSRAPEAHLNVLQLSVITK